MENLARAAAIAALCIGCAAGSHAESSTGVDLRPLTGLEYFDETFGPAASSCELGFIATGTPLVVTRTLAWAEEAGLAEADRLLAVDGNRITNGADLRNALGSRDLSQTVRVSIGRGDKTVALRMRCRDATDILNAREEALISATQNRWNDCIRATYVEEMLWGGSNSLSAGLRLWCHQARQGHAASTAILETMDARLIYEYVARLAAELQHVAGVGDDIHARLNHQAERIAQSGHTALAAELDALLVGRLH